MTTLQCELDSVQQRRERATRITFLIAGIAIAAWAPLVPYLKNGLAIDDGGLGLLLLCLGLGSLVAMPVTSALVVHMGARRVIVMSALVCLSCLPLLAGLSSFLAAFITLLVFGASIGMLDVAMNLQAVAVERTSGRSLMSGFHGLFSLGSIVGVSAMMGLLALGLSPTWAASIVVMAALLGLVMAWSGLLNEVSADRSAPTFALPRGIVLLLGAICAISFLVEGAMLDWIGVLLHEYRDVSTAWAGLGYALFSVSMTIGRLSGDRLIGRFGHVPLVTLGTALAAFGMLLISLVPHWLVAGLGAMLVGLGCSNLVPIMFSLAGRQTLMPERVALPAVVTLGYAGLLAGPAAIGHVANVTSLVMALVMLALLLAAATVMGARLPRSRYLKLR
uniref:MFS transporter n=1 Tax=Halomonas sp. TaxID=1486246 RepID=UPI0026385773|nr:MFS transporter [Halomonas sp.]